MGFLRVLVSLLGALVVGASADAKPECLVTLPACKLRPDRVGTFLDDVKLTLTEIRCLRRAEEWTKICENDWNQVAYATWLPSGKAAVFPDGCVLYSLACVSDPTKSNKMWLEDSIKTQLECSDRAKYHHQRCQNPMTVPMTATWVYSGFKEQYPQGCVINQNACPTNSQMNGTFIDYLPSARKWKDKCMGRAKEIHDFCGNTDATLTLAVFPETMDATTYPSACVVIQPMCAGVPDMSGIFLDTQSRNESLCLARAVHFAELCMNPFEHKTITKWSGSGKTNVVNGTVIVVETDAAAGAARFKETPSDPVVSHVTLTAKHLSSFADDLLAQLSGGVAVPAATEVVSSQPLVTDSDDRLARFAQVPTSKHIERPAAKASPIHNNAPEAPEDPQDAPPSWLTQQFVAPQFED